MISGSDVRSPVCDHPGSLPACLRRQAELVQCRWLLAFYSRATARVMLQCPLRNLSLATPSRHLISFVRVPRRSFPVITHFICSPERTGLKG